MKRIYGVLLSSFAAAFFLIAFNATAAAQDVLYSFSGPEQTNAFPHGALIKDAAGALYGTTFGAPLVSVPCNCVGAGTVYKLTPAPRGNAWTYTVLHAFSYPAGPYAGVISDASGALYGVTYKGGATDNGTIFRLAPPNWTPQVLHEFNGADGANPYGSLAFDSGGRLWGTTKNGGASGQGTLFMLTLPPSGKFQVLHSFSGGADGGHPGAGVVFGPNGRAYGCTGNGAGTANAGTIFAATNDSLSTLFTFSGTDGTGCSDSLVVDSTGALYGTTYTGGSGGGGNGTVFKLVSTPPTWTHTVLHSFGTTAGDGINPWGSPVIAPNGSLYGTTLGGGTGNGAIYKVALPSGTYSMHPLSDPLNSPQGGLMSYGSGVVIGTTYHGGSAHFGNVFSAKLF